MDPARTPAVIWLTGLPSSGKTTIARLLAQRLGELGRPTEVLDGDDIRAIFPSTGFTREERDQHIRRIAFAASLLEKHGVTPIVALVSPYRDSREFARTLSGRFLEIHVSTPLAECERRDVKGLYARARQGLGPPITGMMTGIDDAYEAPVAPELVIDTAHVPVERAVETILEACR